MGRSRGPAARAPSPQALFRQVFDGAPVGMLVVDAQGAILTVNQVFCELLGHAPQALAGRSVLQFTHPGERRRVLALAGRLARGEAGRDPLDSRFLHRDGTTVHVALSTSILRGSHGEPLHYVAHVEHVAARRRLAQERQFFAELGPELSSSLDGDEILRRVADVCTRHVADHCLLVSVDPEAHVRRKLLASRDPGKRWLSAAIAQFRVDPRRPSMLGEALDLQRPVLLSHSTDEALAAMAQSAEHLRLLHALDIVSMITVPLLASGQCVGAMALITSGASRPYDEQDLRMADELARRAALALENARLYRVAVQASKARDEVLAVVAHDLRNPLGTIATQAALLRRRAQPRAGAEGQAGEVIQAAVSRMTRLIRDLLDVSCMEAGQLSVRAVPLATADVLSACVDMQRPLAAQAGVDLRLDMPPALPDILADRDRLLQILENLIGNALKFGAAGGEVTVGALPQGRHVAFSVSDRGPGVADADLPHLFDRFWQARREQRDGAGLGLPIVKGLVEAHGGTIAVRSIPGRGVAFTFTIPRARPAE